jgi:hypothetical protein
LGGRIEQTFRGKPTSLLRRLGLRVGSLKKFVEETGGELISETPDKMTVALGRIVDNLSASYTAAYMPTNLVRDGKRRRIKVSASEEVEKREGRVVMRARRSYVMTKEAPAVRTSTK